MKGHLSASQLNLFAQCPRRWHYYVTDAPAADTDLRYADCGRRVHKAIETSLHGIQPDHAELTKGLDGEMYDRYLRCYENYIGLRRALDLVTASVEVPLEATVNGVRLMGYLDVLDGDLCIDWKTGKPSPGERIQAAVYQYLMRRNGVTDPRVAFVYLLDGRSSPAPTYPDEYVEVLVGNILKAVADDNYPATGNGCRWCPYSHICEVG